MKRSDIFPLPHYFDRYIQLVEDIELLKGLETALEQFRAYDFTLLEQLGNKAYAEGKWTVKDILQHIIDTERIMGYRALRFARQDTTALPGFDENLFAATANAERRSIQLIASDFIAARQNSIALFKSFDDEMLMQKGIAFKSEISVLALGFVLIGHQEHHFGVIKERYLPLLNVN